MVSGLQGASNVAGSAGFSLDINGAGNLNGNAAIDGSFANAKQSDDIDVGIQNEYREEFGTDGGEELQLGGEEIGMSNGNNFGNVRPGEINNAALGAQSFGNFNSQSSLNQYGMANSNLQGGIIQQEFRRQSKSIHQLPNQHIVCGYHYKTIYPNVQLQSYNAESDDIGLNGPLVGQYTMRRFYSGPFNHLL